jgi:hypothetical protein
MNSVLNNGHTDLAVLNGDLISCENVAIDMFNNIIDRIVSPLVDRSLPFATTFGNHDYAEDCDLALWQRTCGGISKAITARSYRLQRNLWMAQAKKLVRATTATITMTIAS